MLSFFCVCFWVGLRATECIFSHISGGCVEMSVILMRMNLWMKSEGLWFAEVAVAVAVG